MVCCLVEWMVCYLSEWTVCLYEIDLDPHVVWTPRFMIFRSFVGLPVMYIPNSDRHSLAVGACGNLLAGATSFGFLGATFVAGLLND